MAYPKYRHTYCDIVRSYILAGFDSDADIAKVCGVSESTVKDWKRSRPEFRRACDMAVMDAAAECAARHVEFARDGSESANRFILDRVAPRFEPRQKVDHTSNGNTLAGLLAEHKQISDAEARERGLISDACSDACEE